MNMTNYRKLTSAEIEVLKQQVCSASDWDQIEVAEGFLPEPSIIQGFQAM